MNIVAVDQNEKCLADFKHVCTQLDKVTSCTTFQSPVKALDYIKKNAKEVGLLVTEVDLDEMNGMELVEKAHAINENIKAVILTVSPNYALRAFEVDAIGYLLKPISTQQLQRQLEKATRYSAGNAKPRVFIRTFGHFDVFVDGLAVRFSSAKAKELLALLVDRRGGVVTMAEAIGNLWENREYDDSVRSLYRNVLQSLRETLAQAGISEIFINTRNSRSVNTTKFECDYYQLLDGKSRGITSFNGTYMEGYPWGAPTLDAIRAKLGQK